MQKRTHKKEYTYTGSTGFTLLFAVFASALVLSIGLSIYTIAIKELLLSSAGRESQRAFAAADSGVECALYWDFQHNVFTPQLPDEGYSSNIACGGSTATVSTGESYPNTNSFSVVLAEGNCVDVSITKHDNISLPTCPGSRCTIIIASGYNTCEAGSPIRLQRTLRFNY